MRVIQINCVYPNGSTGKITSEIHQALLKENHDSFVIYGRGKKCYEKNIIKVCNDFFGKVNHLISRFTGLVYGGCIWETIKLIYQIKKIKPDVVHLQCINGYFVNIFRLIKYLKKKSIPMVVTLHADFMYTANCGSSFECDKWMVGCGECPRLFEATESYVGDRTHFAQLLMKNAFEGSESNSIVIGVSKWISNRAQKSPVMKNMKIKTIYNGINVGVFNYRNKTKNINRVIDSGNKKMILWVTSILSNEKGKDMFFKLTEMMDSEKYHFVVVGSRKPSDYNGNATFHGVVHDVTELAHIYTMADVVISCSKQESYPTVLIEAQCCGTPVVGFDVGGVREAIYPGMGEVVPLGDIYKMQETIEKWMEVKSRLTEDKLEECVQFFSSDRMCQEYISLYKTMIG